MRQSGWIVAGGAVASLVFAAAVGATTLGESSAALGTSSALSRGSGGAAHGALDAAKRGLGRSAPERSTGARGFGGGNGSSAWASGSGGSRGTGRSRSGSGGGWSTGSWDKQTSRRRR